ncbi:MAG: NAD(P)H-hydrate dehydratase [Candidatus Aenigmarchaeota archaeon]|nr:NAD(P)H-hydrate dehydratase [Candidatus Aenigmarchaeota archaeon]
MIETKPSMLRKVYKKRNEWAHKYNFGHLLVIGGSKQYSGSPSFNAMAAYRSGVDLVTVVAPERAANIISSFKPDMIAYPLEGDFLRPSHLREILKIAEKTTAFVIGGGLGREKETKKAVVKWLSSVTKPGVIDADAIHAVSENLDVIKNKNFILTPHAHEFYILSGIRVKDEIAHRVKVVKEFAKKLGVTVLLKGHVDVISDGKKVILNKTGTPYMTKGGLGDVLAGICGALLTRDCDPLIAASVGAFISGKAGELASKIYGEGLMASDVIDFIPKVIITYTKR